MADRLADTRRFYDLLDRLEGRIGGSRTLADCNGRMKWPNRGIYFFCEAGEVRSSSGAGPRIVRIGTHGLKSGSRSTLWARLSQHRGTARSSDGNHRGLDIPRARRHCAVAAAGHRSAVIVGRRPRSRRGGAAPRARPGRCQAGGDGTRSENQPPYPCHAVSVAERRRRTRPEKRARNDPSAPPAPHGAPAPARGTRQGAPPHRGRTRAACLDGSGTRPRSRPTARFSRVAGLPCGSSPTSTKSWAFVTSTSR